MPFDFSNSEKCTVCGTELEFTVAATLTGPDQNTITPIEVIVCPECGTEYQFDPDRQEWQPKAPII